MVETKPMLMPRGGITVMKMEKNKIINLGESCFAGRTVTHSTVAELKNNAAMMNRGVCHLSLLTVSLTDYSASSPSRSASFARRVR
jgi:hypothetical protein